MKKVQVGLLKKQIILTIIPAVLITLISSVVATWTLQKSIKRELETSLKSTAIMVIESYDSKYAGDYKISDKGKLAKGSSTIEDDTSILDQVDEKTGIVGGIYYGDQLYVCSYVDKESHKRLKGEKSPEIVARKVLQEGVGYLDLHNEIAGTAYYAYYEPLLSKKGEVVGMAYTARKAEEIEASIKQTNLGILVCSIAVLLLSIAIILPLIRRMVKAVTVVEKDLRQVATGDLNIEVKESILKRNDEIGKLASSTKNLSKSLKKMLGTIINLSEHLAVSAKQLDHMSVRSSETTQEVSAAIQEISAGISTQAEETQNVGQNITHMGEMIGEIRNEIEALKDNALQMNQCEQETGVIVSELEAQNSKTLEAVDAIAKQTVKTNDSVTRIREVVGLITAIAKQTNLLSLNATIEAARAGEAGKGFAVVAGEIQGLAEQCNTSAKEIEEITNELVSNSELTVSTMKQVKITVDEQNEKLLSTKKKFGEINQMIDHSNKAVMGIDDKINELNGNKEEIMQSVQRLSAIAQENAASSEETTASTEEISANSGELAEAAKALREVVKQLKEETNSFNL